MGETEINSYGSLVYSKYFFNSCWNWPLSSPWQDTKLLWRDTISSTLYRLILEYKASLLRITYKLAAGAN